MLQAVAMLPQAAAIDLVVVEAVGEDPIWDGPTDEQQQFVREYLEWRSVPGQTLRRVLKEELIAQSFRDASQAARARRLAMHNTSSPATARNSAGSKPLLLSPKIAVDVTHLNARRTCFSWQSGTYWGFQLAQSCFTIMHSRSFDGPIIGFNTPNGCRVKIAQLDQLPCDPFVVRDLGRTLGNSPDRRRPLDHDYKTVVIPALDGTVEFQPSWVNGLQLSPRSGGQSYTLSVEEVDTIRLQARGKLTPFCDSSLLLGGNLLVSVTKEGRDEPYQIVYVHAGEDWLPVTMGEMFN